MRTLSANVKPHSLNKSGNSDYCIITLVLDIDGELFYDSHSMYSSYVLDQKEYSQDLLEKVIHNLKTPLLNKFGIDDVEERIDNKALLTEMESIRKETLDTSKKSVKI